MKKLNKFQINPNKIVKNEELVRLRGGYGDGGDGGGTMALNCKYWMLHLGCIYLCCGITYQDALAICITQYPTTNAVGYQCGYNCGFFNNCGL